MKWNIECISTHLYAHAFTYTIIIYRGNQRIIHENEIVYKNNASVSNHVSRGGHMLTDCPAPPSLGTPNAETPQLSPQWVPKSKPCIATAEANTPVAIDYRADSDTVCKGMCSCDLSNVKKGMVCKLTIFKGTGQIALFIMSPDGKVCAVCRQFNRGV